MTDRDDSPSEAELLLPWYGTGRLTPEETSRVEAWLEAHPEGREQLALIRAEMDTDIVDNEALPTPSSGAADRLMDRVTAEPGQRARRLAAGLLERFGTWIDSVTPEMRGGLVAAAVVLVIAQAVVIGLMAGREPTTFETATGGGTATEGQIIVGFTADATAAEINALLAETGASIVAGPKPGGLYALAFPKDVDLDAVVEMLAARKDTVSFAARGSAE